MSKTSSISSIIYEIESYIKHSKKESFTFKLNELPFHDNYSMDIRKHNQFIPLFQSLNSKKHHCLYWFSTSTEKDALHLKKLIENKRYQLLNQQDKRVIPAKNDNRSNVIYLGVRKKGGRKYTMINRKRINDELSNISGRIIQHLGYYRKGSTQGLQLAHWSNEEEIDITLNIIEFPNLSDAYLYIIEKLYAIELKPILGKH